MGLKGTAVLGGIVDGSRSLEEASFIVAFVREEC